jgi:hypothetical protein
LSTDTATLVPAKTLSLPKSFPGGALGRDSCRLCSLRKVSHPLHPIRRVTLFSPISKKCVALFRELSILMIRLGASYPVRGISPKLPRRPHVEAPWSSPMRRHLLTAALAGLFGVLLTASDASACCHVRRHRVHHAPSACAPAPCSTSCPAPCPTPQVAEVASSQCPTPVACPEPCPPARKCFKHKFRLRFNQGHRCGSAC